MNDLKNLVSKLISEIEAGKDEAQAAAQAAEAARAAAWEWAGRVIRGTPPEEARALGRRVIRGDVPQSPLLAALVIIAASGEPEAAEALRALGVRSGIVETGKNFGRVIVTLPTGRAFFRFYPPATCRGVQFIWRDPSAEDGSPSGDPSSSLGARARIKRAR